MKCIKTTIECPLNCGVELNNEFGLEEALKHYKDCVNNKLDFSDIIKAKES